MDDLVVYSLWSLSKHRRRRIDMHGVTLIELMVTLSILAILIMVAAPGVSQFIVSNRLTGQSNSLFGDLSRARSEAAARHTSISVCAAATSTTCAAASGTSWSAGWLVFVDGNADGVLAASTDILKYVPPLDGSPSVTSANFTKTGVITYRPYGGISPSSGGDLTFCVSGYASGRKISIAATGRPLIARVNTCP